MTEPSHDRTDDTRAPLPSQKMRRVLGFKIPVWQAIITAGVGAALTGVVVLTITHKSAVTENGIAYVNGYIQGFTDNVINTLLEGYF